MPNAEHTNEDSRSESSGGANPLPPDDRREVVIDVLASALIDLLLEERSRVGGKHEATTC
jgi:hypothetical protein